MLNDTSTPTTAEVTTALHDEVSVEFEWCHIDNRCLNDEEVLAQKLKSAVKEMSWQKLFTMFKESLDNIRRASFHNKKFCFRSIVCHDVEQEML